MVMFMFALGDTVTEAVMSKFRKGRPAKSHNSRTNAEHREKERRTGIIVVRCSNSSTSVEYLRYKSNDADSGVSVEVGAWRRRTLFSVGELRWS